MIKIAPSILSCDFGRLAEELKAIEKAGADWAHMDIMDGHFVPNLTMGPDMVAKVRELSGLHVDVHLMLANPQNHIQDYIDSGAQSISFHLESQTDCRPLLESLSTQKIMAGLALRPLTPVSVLEPYLEFLDFVLILSVNPGFSGQKIMPRAIEKIKRAKTLFQKFASSILIEVDGGIHAQNAKTIIQNGADVLVSGSTIFQSDNYTKIISQLRGAP